MWRRSTPRRPCSAVWRTARAASRPRPSVAGSSSRAPRSTSRQTRVCEVPFDVVVPGDVSSGDHLGGIALWEPAAATTNTSGETGSDKATTKITMVTRMVLTVYAVTPGPAVPELTVSQVGTEARPDGMYLIVEIANNGTGPTRGEGDGHLPAEGFQADDRPRGHDPGVEHRLPGQVEDGPRRRRLRWSGGDPLRGRYQGRHVVRKGQRGRRRRSTALADRLVAPEEPAEHRRREHAVAHVRPGRGSRSSSSWSWASRSCAGAGPHLRGIA